MNTERSQRFTFVKNNDLKFIQEFVNTKVYNPDLIERLKLKQLKKLQLQKVKLHQENLRVQVEKSSQNLVKLKKIHAETKVTLQIKNQESLMVEQKITQIGQTIEKLLNSTQLYENQQKQKKASLLKGLIEQKAANLTNEHFFFKGLVEDKKQKVSTLVQKKVKLSQSLINLNKELSDRKIKNSLTKSKIQEKSKFILNLEENKLKITESISSKLILKEQNLRNTKLKVSQNTKSEEQCIKKLQKFVKELNLIVEDPKSVLQQKKSMIDLLLNVYCPDQNVKIKARSLSISPQKEKHDSIQTRVSFENNSQKSNDDNTDQTVKEQMKIPLLLLHSLDEMARKYGIKQKSINSPLKSPKNIRKISSFEQTQIKPKLIKIDHRNSLPSSLNQKDLQDQFLAYCQNQLNELDATQRVLDQKESKIEKQIKLLKQKCDQKDEQISSIVEQNRRSFKKA